MSPVVIPPSSFNFLKKLKQNNNRDWFNAHKGIYLQELAHIAEFAESLLNEMNKHDAIETPSGKKSLHRIYRDTRFSKIKTPYNTHWGGSFSRVSKLRRGTYYFHLSPGNSFAEGGFWGPNTGDMKRLRDEFVYDHESFRKILQNKNFVKHFGKLKGEQLKTAPRGFDSAEPAIDLLRYKQFLLVKNFTDKEVLDKNFVKVLNKTFMEMRPFLDYMSNTLTTDLNGISLI